MDVFVARQPILGNNLEVYAYELLFRSSADPSRFDGTDSTLATRQVIANTLFSAGLEGILAGKKAFINFDRNLLVNDGCAILPKESTVIEILETVEPDEAVIDACRKLRANGHMLALDDFVNDAGYEALIRLADIIKVDLRVTPRGEQERLVTKYKARGIRMLAEKVETHEEFEWARRAGYDYYQGYFFARPLIVKGRQIPSSKMACLRLLQEAQREEIDFNKLAALIHGDVSFSYKLLRYINSAMFAHHDEIRTIERALMILGETGIRRWIAVAALPGLAKDKPHELVTQSLVRAQFCEKLLSLTRSADLRSGFMLGLFSLLDALLDQPMPEALVRIHLAPPVSEVLLGAPTEFGALVGCYELMKCYESGDWSLVDDLAKRLVIPPTAISDAYVEATRWAMDVWRAAA